MCNGTCSASSPQDSCCCMPSRESQAGGKGDGGWWEAWAELYPMHVDKSGTYGNQADALANYVNTSEQLGQPDEYTPMARIIEKLERARNMVLAGRADEVKEWPDIAALAIGAEALRRRRL